MKNTDNMALKNILIIDDDNAHRLMLRESLRERGFKPLEAASGEEGLKTLETEIVDLVLLDIKMHGMGGMEALKQIRGFNPALPVIMMTAYATVETAIEALKVGAVDYLLKPLDMEELEEAVRAAIEPAVSRTAGRTPSMPELKGLDLVAESAVMNDILAEAVKVAPTDATVLLTGESGSGKEVLAEAIHRMSLRAGKRIMTLNCAAIPDTLIESELFGHKKGSFTGADRDKEGRFQAAGGGTLFLDEIGELPLPAQAKLLRVLQDGRITPVGGTQEIDTNVRIIAATNRNLEEEVKEGRFREDLYYRISVFPIRIPPLRERKIDIPPLAELFLKRFSRRHGKDIKGFTPRALTSLLSHDWPGNVRELMNVIERAIILSRGDYLEERDLPGIGSPEAMGKEDPASRIRAGISLREMEKILIERTLTDTDSNRTHAARILGITRKTLLAKVREYGIEG
ncbi:MAG: sigma-54 dependent transcriptional regulator [bacterium]|nr:sigma-54 dependent transcriptional regulator [bacterium]